RPRPSLESWMGQALPLGCLPPSSFGPKVKLLRRGTATFEVWAHPSGDGARLTAPPPTPNEGRLAARVTLEGLAPLAGPHGWSKTRSDKHWKQLFGNFPQGAWIQNRHALAHLRAPLLSPTANDEARQAHEMFVARLLEALRR